MTSEMDEWMKFILLRNIANVKLELIYTNYEIASLINDTAHLNMMRIGSKPIDIRQLNSVLNRLIRDKQSHEAIQTARWQAEAKKAQASKSTDPPDNNGAPLAIDTQFAEIFVWDASKTLAILN